MILLKPLFVGVAGGIPGLTTAYDGVLQVLSDSGIYPEATDFAPMSSCDMLSQFGQKMPDGGDSAGNGLKIAQILLNTFFQLLVAFMFRYLLKEFKKLVANFLIARAINKLERKKNKNIAKYSLFAGVDPDKIRKAQKYAKAVKPITKFIEFS